MRDLRRCFLTTAVMAMTIVPTPSAHALFHLIKITEVFAGTTDDADAQFIEMQMYADNQRFLASHEIVTYDASGAESGRFTFTSPAENGSSQAYVLIATAAAEETFGVPADLVMEPVLSAGGGKVCFTTNQGEAIDCASWGAFSGEDEGSGTPFNAPVGLAGGRAMERDVTGGDNPGGLDEDDDTDDSAADFDAATPSPTNNAGATSDTEQHERSVTLRMRPGERLTASGMVSSEYPGCRSDVAVKLQRRREGAWKTVASTTTDGNGRFRMSVRDIPATYRAKAPATTPEPGHGCLAATSPRRKVT